MALNTTSCGSTLVPLPLIKGGALALYDMYHFVDIRP